MTPEERAAECFTAMRRGECPEWPGRQYNHILDAVRDAELAAFRRGQGSAAERIDALEAALRSLACYLSVGGYNADAVDPAVFEQKIRDGIDMASVGEFRRGQEAMQAKAAALVRGCDGHEESLRRSVIADAIAALPLE